MVGSMSLSSHQPDENRSWNIKFHFCAIHFLIGKSLRSTGCRLLPVALNHVPRLTKPCTDPQKPSDRQHAETCHKITQTYTQEDSTVKPVCTHNTQVNLPSILPVSLGISIPTTGRFWTAVWVVPWTALCSLAPATLRKQPILLDPS